MGETLAQLRTELLARGFDGVPADRADRFLNLGIQRVCRHALWTFMETFIEGYEQGDPISDLHAISSVRITGGGIPLDYRSAYLPRDLQGTPSCFYLASSGDSTGNPAIYGYPQAESTLLDVSYYSRHAPLVDGADVCRVPAAFSEVILDAAGLAASKDLREWDSVAAFKQELVDGLAEMSGQLLDQQVVGNDYIEIPGY